MILQAAGNSERDIQMRNEEIIRNRVQRHKNFWSKTNDSPLIGYSLGNYFVSKRFNAVENLLGTGKCVKSDDLNVERFLNDYDSMYLQTLEEGADRALLVCPFTGLPWMEAMFGCKVISQESSFIASPVPGAEFSKEIQITDYSWSDKYFEFIDFINKNGEGSTLRGSQFFGDQEMSSPEFLDKKN